MAYCKNLHIGGNSREDTNDLIPTTHRLLYRQETVSERAPISGRAITKSLLPPQATEYIMTHDVGRYTKTLAI